MTEQEQGLARILGTNLQKFLQHALDCSNPSCILPLCVNTKLTLQHSQGCKKHKCAICQEMKSLASKHSDSCVDFHCRIPFCMEAKLDTHKRARIDLSDCLDAILKDNENAEGSTEIERVDIATTARSPGCLKSLRNSQDRESTPIHTARTQGCLESLTNSQDRESTAIHTVVTVPTSPSFLKPLISMNSYSPVASSTMVNLSAPFCKTSSIANLPRLCPDQGRGQSSINTATDTNDSPWCGFIEPFPASQDSTFTTTTQERATPRSLVVKRNARENTARNHQPVMTGLLFPSPPTRKQNATQDPKVRKEKQSLQYESSSSSRNQDGLSNAPGRSVKETTTRQIIEERPPFNLSSRNESPPNQTTSTQQEFSLLRTNSYPQVNLKRINRSASLNTPATYAKTPRLQSEHRRCKSLVKQNSVTATSQWDPFMEPSSASCEDPLTARTQAVPNPLFSVKGSIPGNVTRKQQSLKANSSISTVQSENAQSQQVRQSTDREIQKTTYLLNTACLSSVAQASHSASRAIGISDHVSRDSRTLLKARLIHTLYHLLHLIMQKLETREEIFMCIKSLRNALHEIKTLQ
ncbi:hypothetical protein ACROYT_G017978 [Oculina patagonica]